MTAPLREGIHDAVPFDAYLSDPCPDPSLSASIAVLLIDKSPLHAKLAHPRLNPAAQADSSKAADIGTAAHALLLEGEDVVQIVDADSWRTKAAQAARDAAREAGKVPLLAHQAEAVKAMAYAARAQLLAGEDTRAAFSGGKPEQTLVWQEETPHGAIWCRARLDWLPGGGNVFLDFKTTAASAAPDDFQRTFFSMRYDLKAAFYRRGIKALGLAADPVMLFPVQEVEPPYAMTVFGCIPEVMERAEAEVAEAIRRWGLLLKSGAWWGYPRKTCWLGAPAYLEYRQEDRRARAEAIGDDARAFMREFNAPIEE